MKYILKNEIFDIFENARELFNDYYNGKEEYTQEDYKKILEIDKYNDAADKIKDIQSGNKIITANIFKLSHRKYIQHGQTEKTK